MHGVSSSSARSSSAWFHSHPRACELIHLLASIVESLSRNLAEISDRAASAPSTPPPSAGSHLHLPLTSSPNDRYAESQFGPRLRSFSPPDSPPSSPTSFSRSPDPHRPLPNSASAPAAAPPTTLYLLKMALGSLFRVTVDAAPAKEFLLDRHPRFLTTVLTLVEKAPSKDVVRFGFFLLHQLALLVPPDQFRVEDAAAVVATALRKYQGTFSCKDLFFLSHFGRKRFSPEGYLSPSPSPTVVNMLITQFTCYRRTGVGKIRTTNSRDSFQNGFGIGRS